MPIMMFSLFFLLNPAYVILFVFLIGSSDFRGGYDQKSLEQA